MRAKSGRQKKGGFSKRLLSRLAGRFLNRLSSRLSNRLSKRQPASLCVRFAARAALGAAGLCLIAGFAAAGDAIGARWGIGIDPQAQTCLERRVWLIEKFEPEAAPPALERDAVYVFAAEGLEPLMPKGTKLAKRLAAEAGDVVEITPDFEILVNGRAVARGLPHLSEADPAAVRARFVGRRVLGENECWMSGASALSFDSRYFGPVPCSRLIGRAHALF